MRTKVERNCKKNEQRKANISLPSPKVVLNADDCARLLDSMGKASDLLVEDEAKVVPAASSTPPVQSSSVSTLLTTSPLCSLSSDSRNVSSPLWAATQTNICKNWAHLDSANITKTTESSESANSERPSIEGVKEAHQGILLQNQTILKPPKKRRGIDKKFEDITPTPFISSNKDAIHSVVSSKEELVDERFEQRSGNTSLLTLPSHRDMFQKHSVEQLLQHNPGSSVSANNNQTLISSNYSHDSRSHILSLKDLSSSPVKASTPLSSPLSSNLENYVGRASQLYSHSFSTASHLSQNHLHGTYFGHTSSVECLSSLSHSNLVSANKTHSGNFQQLPEQIEPMNLSTSCKPAMDIASFHVSSKADGQTSEDVSAVFSQQQSPSHGFSETSDLLADNICESSTKDFESEDSEVRQSENKPIEVPQDVSLPGGLCTESHILDQSIHNGESSCVSAGESCGSKDIHISKTPDPPATSDLPYITVSSISTVGQNKGTGTIAGEYVDKNVCSSVEQNPQSLSPNYSTQLSGSDAAETLLLLTPTDSQTVGINDKESPAVIENETAKLNKRPPKKKMKVPMDDMSCADRMHRYSLTVDDVVANFVYIPEPLEEFSLTEEEEAAIRDQFENVHDSSNTGSKDFQISHNHGVNIIDSTSVAGVQNGHDKPSADSDIHNSVKPDKRRSTLVLAGSTAESHQNVQQTGDHIDSVLAFVAGDCFSSAPPIDNSCSDNISTGKQKKLKRKLVGDVNNKEISKSKKMKRDHVSDKVNNQHNTDSIQVYSENPEMLNVIVPSEDNLTEVTDKISKVKKIKKKKSAIGLTTVIDQTITSVLEADEIAEDKMATPLKKKEIDRKFRITKKKKTEIKQMNLAAYSATDQVVHTIDKDTICPNRAETSDIGESIASTSGGSEQDTPVHEPESKEEMTSTDAQVTDRENHDTGLESGDDKPVRRYKKRLDLVKCDQCDHQARGRSALSRHMKKVHMLDVTMPFRCEHCDYGCTKMASLNRHLFTHDIYPCSRCSFVADERVKLTEHTMEKHKDKLDVKMCKVCNRYIKCDLITIEQHTQECQGPTPFQCKECDKEFKYASSLRVHYHTHFPDQPKRFKCDQCEYRTNYKANLHKHHKNMHASKDRDVQCPECGKLFSTEDNMRRHRKVHTLVRPFACGTCEKTFKTSGALKGHQLIHTATRPYTCNIPGCNRNFRTPKFLKSHQEEFHRLVPKKFFCSVEGCTYSFFKRSHLKRHAITHTGERNFHCTWPSCSKSFRHADNLKVHFRSHTNEKPIQCHLCDFKCKQKNSLFWHKKRVHQIIDVSMCPRRLENKLKPTLAEDVEKIVESVSDVHVRENAQVISPPTESVVKTLVIEASTDITGTAEEVSTKSEDENPPLVSTTEEINETIHSPSTMEHRTPAVSQKDHGHKDLYEFKSDEESEEEIPGSFRRDRNVMAALTPLPPPPKELLRKNEILEMKEREKKEKAEKREQERKEKAERKEQEKNEKEEKKNLEKIAKAERKELEKQEKIIKKEQEKKDRIEKKEQEKKDKLEKKEIEKKEKIEKKEQEKKEKIDKKQQEKMEKEQEKKTEEGETEKKVKSEKTMAVKTSSTEKANVVENGSDHEDKNINVTKKSLKSLKRRKSSDLVTKENYLAETKRTRQSRRKLYEDINDKTPPRAEDDEKPEDSSPKRKVCSTKKRRQSEEQSSLTTSLSSMRTSATKRNLAQSKKQGKLSPPKRKPSARIKAKKNAKTVNTKSTLKGQKSLKPELKRKSMRKMAGSTVKQINELKQVDMNSDDLNAMTDTNLDLMKSEESHPLLEEKVLPKSNNEESLALPAIPSSPASSEEIMLQGKASPYRDFSDAETEEEQTKDHDSSFSETQSTCQDIQESCEMEADLLPYEKIDTCILDSHTLNPAEESSDDDVSNDIPLTPPRAPAPPPVESSEDEMEELDPEATPFSVPGPNTPFSVPGPNTPFSIPPPSSLTQQHSIHSEEAPMSSVPSVPSMEMHSHGSVDMQQSLESVEIHPHGSEEMNHSCGSVEMHHPQSSFEMPHTHSAMEIRSHNSLEMRSHGSVEMVQPRESVDILCHGSITESIHHSEQQVRTPESVMRDISNNTMSEKYELPPSLQEQTQTSDADKEYFDQYLKSLSAANNRAARDDLEPSPGGLQQLEAMVVKSHLDSKEMNSKSPISYLPTSVITSLESTLPLLSHGDLRARMDALVSDRHHESLYIRDTPSSLSRLQDRQTPLPSSVMGHSPAFDTFSSLNSLHPVVASGGRENPYLRQAENLFPTPPGTGSFMAEAMFQRQAVSTPFLPPQQADRSSLSRIPDATELQPSSSSSILRRSGTVPGSDMFSPPTMAQGMPRHPFANTWASQDVRAVHWQNPYLSHQSNMAATGSFFPTKESYLAGRDFMFDPSVRPATERSMFPSLSSSQSQDSFQLDRFDLSNYFSNAMTPYGSSSGSLEYSRSAHAAATKPFDNRYRHTAAAAAAIPDFRGLPPTGGTADMFSGLPAVNPGFNLYAGNPMSYHAQHMTDNVNSAFLTHTTSAQHAMFERDYAAAHRSFYPQNTAYAFVDERQYPGASKLGHSHPVAPTPVPQERDLMSRSAAPESQMQDPYRSLLYRY